MKNNFFRRTTVCGFILFQLMCCKSVVSAQDKLATILQGEVNREFATLIKQQVPVYYISYRVDEVSGFRAIAQFGSIVSSDNYQSKILTINLRVGTPALDNYHPTRDGQNFFGYGRIELPAENNADAIKNSVWKATNDAYLDAVSKFSKVKANVSVKVEEEDKAADFTLGTPVVFEESPIKFESLKLNTKEWEKRLKRYSAEFLKDSAIFSGTSTFDVQVTRKIFISTNGDRVIHNLSSTNLALSGSIKAKDGMELPLYKSFTAFRPDGLPTDKEMMKSTEEIVTNLTALKNAPVAEPFSGPALLSASASGVFFHEIFGHRVEGQRMKNENDAQTFKKKVGDIVLPKTLTVYCDPLQKTYQGVELNGYYQYDDEGTKTERVTIVENGVLRNFLMSRSPIKGFSKSNGHGRAQAGLQPVSRQSNLVIETSEHKTTSDLRNELIRLAKEQKLAYGYLFQEVTGGFTTTGRFMPSAFNVMPTLVYRIYVDGRPDEIVRGVDLIGTPLAMFSQIDMAGGEKGVFNGICGAESGGVPVSCCSPTFLVKMIETQKKGKSQERPYILPRPTENK